MVFKNFRLNYIARIILMIFFLSSLYISIYYHIITTSIIAIFFLIWTILSLLHYVEQTNKDLKSFFEAINYDDFTHSFKHLKKGKPFDDLRDLLNKILEKFRETRAEKEKHYRTLQIVIEHIGVGILVFSQNGEILLINKAAKKILSVSFLKNIYSLNKLGKNFVHTLEKIKHGEKVLQKIAKMEMQLNLFATEFILRESKYKLVSIQNIQAELEEKEMEAWQNLIRVLTHEINNSITPIASLASTANNLLQTNPLDTLSLSDIQEAVNTIEKRSNGLLHFVESYRELTKLPKPNFQICYIKEIFKRIIILMEPQLKAKNIKCEMFVTPESLQITADPQMITQVLINLVINAIYALKERNDGKIIISSVLDKKGHILISVEDNGIGILEDVQEKIFIPFFTTKKEGSGIGLSLSKQIMRLHKGSISVNSILNEKTVFNLKF